MAGLHLLYKKPIPQKVLALLPVVLLAVYVFCYFLGPITGHGYLSKACMLAEWDSIYDEKRTGNSMNMDPSLVYLMIPSYILKARLWQSGEIPLWNPYSGLGMPLLADPQALVLSPLHIPLIFFPYIETFNFILPFEVFLTGLGTYLLCRQLKLSLPSAIFAMMSATFCPYFLYYMELLGNGFCMVPFTFYFILRLAGDSQQIEQPSRAGTLTCCAFSALGLAVGIFSSHVEMSFCTIMLASLTLLLYTVLKDGAKPGTILPVLGRLILCGIFTFAFAAPLLIPFLEFVKNSQCYKFGSGAPAFIPWQTILFNGLSPGYKAASPSLGAIALPLTALAVFSKGKHKSSIYALAGALLTALIVMAKCPPLDNLLTHAPFSFLVVTYALPAALLLIAILAAFGLEAALALFAHPHDGKTKPAILASLTTVLLLILFPVLVGPLNISLRAANFDLMVGDYVLNKVEILRYSIVVTGFAILLALHKFVVSPTKRKLVASLMVLTTSASFICLSLTSRKAMPTRPKFEYERIEALEKLRSELGHERFIACGSHLIKPNSSAAYRLRGLSCHNPLFPSGFLGIAEKTGAKIDVFGQEYSQEISPLTAVAAVKNIVSLSPIDRGDLKLKYLGKGNIYIYEDTKALPRAYFAEKARLALSSDTDLLELDKKDVLAGNTVVLTSPLPTIGGMSNTKEPSTVKIDKDEPCKIELSLELKDAGYVVLTDINYPGWKAYLDGKEEQIQLANHAMRAVACQPGSHKLVYRYEPGSFKLGAMLFALASLAALAFAVIARLEKRKRNKMQIQIPLPVDNPGH